MQGIKRVFGSDEKKEFVDPYFVCSFAGTKVMTYEWFLHAFVIHKFVAMCTHLKSCCRPIILLDANIQL